MPYPVINREASSYSRWKQMQNLTARHVEIESKWGISIRSLPSELRESHGKRGRKRIRVRGTEDTGRTRLCE